MENIKVFVYLCIDFHSFVVYDSKIGCNPFLDVAYFCV